MQTQAKTQEQVLIQKQEVIVATADEKELSIRASDLVAASGRAVASDAETASKCTDLISIIKKQAKAIDEERRKIVDPLNGVVKHVNARFKPITEALANAERDVKGKLLAYQREEARKAQEAAAARQKEMEEAALREAAAAENGGDTIGANAAVDRAARMTHRAAESTPTVGASGASAGIQKRWTFRVKDKAALAAAYPDTVEVKNSAVMGLFRAGLKDVPGVEFYQEDVLAIR